MAVSITDLIGTDTLANDVPRKINGNFKNIAEELNSPTIARTNVQNTFVQPIIIDRPLSSSATDFVIKRGGRSKGEFFCNDSIRAVGLYNTIANKGILLYDNGQVVFNASNLSTTSKDVIGAINELNDKSVKKDTFNTFSATQFFNGGAIFKGNAPQSEVKPTSGNDLTPKKYVDSRTLGNVYTDLSQLGLNKETVTEITLAKALKPNEQAYIYVDNYSKRPTNNYCPQMKADFDGVVHVFRAGGYTAWFENMVNLSDERATIEHGFFYDWTGNSPHFVGWVETIGEVDKTVYLNRTRQKFINFNSSNFSSASNVEADNIIVSVTNNNTLTIDPQKDFWSNRRNFFKSMYYSYVWRWQTHIKFFKH